MGLFRNLLYCDLNITGKRASLNECDMAENIDVMIGSIMLLSVVLSTLLNPLMIFLKIKERNLIGRIYAYLGMLYFLSNIERGPTTIYKLLKKTYKEKLRSSPNAYQFFAQTLYGFTTQNQYFVLLLISSTRFFKCHRPFRDTNKRLLITSVFIFNIYSAVLAFARWNQKRTFVYISSIQTILLSPQKVQEYDITYILWVLVILITSLSSCVFSLATIRTLRQAPNLTRQSRVSKRRATLVIGLLSFSDCLLTVFNVLTMMILFLDASRLEQISVSFFNTVVSYSVIAGLNPLFILLAGYKGREILDKLKIRIR